MINNNSVNIGLTIDYTSYTDTIDFVIRVPIGDADMDTLTKAFEGTPAVPANGDTPATPAVPATLESIAAAVQTAVNNAAPENIKTLCTSLINTFKGTTST